MLLEGKVALVTAAARRVGRAIATEFARAGADIALHYHSSHDEARAAAEELRSLGRRVELLQADLEDPRKIARMFDVMAEKFGCLDVLVNNAAVYDATPLDGFSVEQWDRQFAVNVRAAALCISHGAKLMASGGTIVNIADTTAGGGRARYAAYCASKAALLSLTRSAAKALAPDITVNAVSPGVAEWAEDADEQRKNAVLASVPMKRPGSAADVAQAVLFLATNPYITAQNLRVDGGWHME